MSATKHLYAIKGVVDELADQSSFPELFSKYEDGDPIPSGKVLYEIIELCRSVLFPGYFGNPTINNQTLSYHLVSP